MCPLSPPFRWGNWTKRIQWLANSPYPVSGKVKIIAPGSESCCFSGMLLTWRDCKSAFVTPPPIKLPDFHIACLLLVVSRETGRILPVRNSVCLLIYSKTMRVSQQRGVFPHVQSVYVYVLFLIKDTFGGIMCWLNFSFKKISFSAYNQNTLQRCVNLITIHNKGRGNRTCPAHTFPKARTKMICKAGSTENAVSSTGRRSVSTVRMQRSASQVVLAEENTPSYYHDTG